MEASRTSAVCATAMWRPRLASADAICSGQPGLAEMSSGASSGQRPGRDVRHYALQTGPGTGHREHAAALLLTARSPSQSPSVLDLIRYSERADRLGVGIDKYGDSRMAAQPGQAAAAGWPDAADRDA
jgi:hypothetical protein